MTALNCTICHCGDVADLVEVRDAFDFLWGRSPSDGSAITWNRGDETSYDLQVVVLGQSGFGKSTLLNRLIGVEAFESSDIEACTRVLQSADFKFEWSRRLGHLSFCDLPGIGENKVVDEEYLLLYRQILRVAHAVIYVVRADQRDHAIDKWAFDKLFDSSQLRTKLTVVLNQIDKMPRGNNHDIYGSEIGADLQRLIDAKRKSVAAILGVEERTIMAVSAIKDIGLEQLAERLSSVLNEHLS